MKVESLAHHVRHVHIILNPAPDKPVRDECDPIAISGQELDANQYDEREQWADESKEGKQQLSADVLAEHGHSCHLRLLYF